MNNPRTVSDTKRAFYAAHTRPIHSIYRRIVEELLVEMHLLRVNENFVYDPVFALGAVTTFERFMQGYRPEADKHSIFQALCQAEEFNLDQLKQDAARLQAQIDGRSGESLLIWMNQAVSGGGDDLQNSLRAIATNPQFKYSRLFAIGLFTLVEAAEPELLKDETQLTQMLEKVATAVNQPVDKIQKDVEQYRSNLDKLTQARKTLEEIVASERKRRQQSLAGNDNRTPESAPVTEAPN